MFATDRDLLSFEPNLFRDVGWLAQRLAKGTGTIAGTVLSMSGQDVDFEAARVALGHVVLAGPAGEATPYEVLQRTSPTELEISRLREGRAAPVIVPSPVVNVTVEVWTLHPQIALAHGQVMRMIGIDPGDAEASPSPANIVNAGAVRHVECLAALHLIYAAAAGPDPGAASTAARAEMYRRRYSEARTRTEVLLDLDGDGVPDATRRFNIAQFTR